MSLRDVLHGVDPNLKFARRGHYRRLSKADWVASTGVVCSSCGHEAFQARDGLCMPCWEKAHEFEIRDKAGVLEFLPLETIMAMTRKVGGSES